MTDAVTVTKGKAEMAYKGEVPWHGLGQELPKGASIDVWTKEAGMDWPINRADVQFSPDGKKIVSWDDKNVLFRGDSGFPLGLVSKGYKIVQPKEVMEFFRDLCVGNQFEMETAGTLFGGRQYWALAKLGEEANVVKGDKLSGYLLLTSSADGTRATTAKFVATRVVCYNTLTMAMREGGKGARVSHRTEFVASNVKLDLGIGHQMFHDFIDVCKELAVKPMTEVDAKRYIGDVLVAQKMAKAEEIEKSRAFMKIVGLFKGEGMGAQLPGVTDTAWGALNAITQWVDHERSRGTDNSTRLNNNIWFGTGERLKNAALEAAKVFVPSKAKAAAKKKAKVVA